MTTAQIKVFSTPTCPYCVMVKEYLKSKGAIYEDIDVSRNQAEARAMMQKSGQMGVPQLWIDGQVVVGFDKRHIDILLAQNK